MYTFKNPGHLRTGFCTALNSNTLALPLVDFIDEGKWPVHVDLLRPPTFENLQWALEVKPNFYHMLHFDGHGEAPSGDASQNGMLIFEKYNQGGTVGDPIPAYKLSALLEACNVPYVLLNACQSASMNEAVDDPFSSVAVSLLKSGISGVVAMSHSLWVSGAEVFVPSFYKDLFDKGSIVEAVYAGRYEMLCRNLRDTNIGEVEFNDWVVPVLYSNTDITGILPKLVRGISELIDTLPDNAKPNKMPGFIGRSDLIHQFEKALRCEQAAILVQGMVGEGKTALIRGVLKWLEATGGGYDVLWFVLEEIRNENCLIDTMGDKLLGVEAAALSASQKITAITEKLIAARMILVWDNFGTIAGYGLLLDLIMALKGGTSKIIIASHAMETWLEDHLCCRIWVGGLRGDDLRRYCNSIVSEFGLAVDSYDDKYMALIQKSKGNPLVIRLLLSLLPDRPVDALLDDFDSGLFINDDASPSAERIVTVFDLLENYAGSDYASTLRVIGLHKEFVDADYVEQILDAVSEPPDMVRTCFSLLERLGFCNPISLQNVYKIHPMLRGYLSRYYPASEPEQRQFVDMMRALCQSCVEKRRLDEQWTIISIFGPSCRYALELAKTLHMTGQILLIVAGLAQYEFDTRNFTEAENLYHDFAKTGEELGMPSFQAAAYHQLGMIAEEKRDFDSAQEWYELSLKKSDKHGKAGIYHQMGTIAFKHLNFTDARALFRKSYKIMSTFNDEQAMASTSHCLGAVEAALGEFGSAKDWCRKSLRLSKKLNDKQGMSKTYHLLGNIYFELEKYDEAEYQYKKALEISIDLKDDQTVIMTYLQLGMAAEKVLRLDDAENYYKNCLALCLEIEDEYNAGSAYHQLGDVNLAKNDLVAAEGWYLEALNISRNQSDGQGISLAFHQLGRVEQARRNYEAAEEWYKKTLELEIKMGLERSTISTYHNLGIVCQDMKNFDQAVSWFDSSLEVSVKLGDKRSEAVTLHHLGRIAEEREDLHVAKDYYSKSLGIVQSHGYEADMAPNLHQLAVIAITEGDMDTAADYAGRALKIFRSNNRFADAEIAEETLRKTAGSL